jgi:hypothetical protein
MTVWNFIKSIFQPYTLQIRLQFKKLLGFSVLALILIWLTAELILRIIPLFSTLPVLALGRDSNQVEIDIKVQRLETLAKKNKVDCFFLGNSMVEAALEPELFVANIKGMETPLTCFNMGLSAADIGTTARLAQYLSRTYHPKVIFLGTNLIDYAVNNNMPTFPDQWLLYETGHFTWEGFLVDSSMVYRYLITAPKYWDRNYKALYELYNQYISASGFREKLKGKGQEILQGAYIYQGLKSSDFSNLKTITDLKNDNMQVIVVEMPISQDYYPIYISGGEPQYNKQFIVPLSAYLKTQGVPFWRSLPEMDQLVSQDGWYNGNHLNKTGADIFSMWLSGQYSRFILNQATPSG